MDHPIAITGMGMITAQGIGVPATWRGVIDQRDVLRPWSLAPQNHPLAKLPVAQCPDLPRPADLPNRLWKTLSRTQQLACIAADEALLQARLPHQLTPDRTALFLATTVCGMDVNERFYRQYRIDPATADNNLMRRLHPSESLHLLARRHNLGQAGLRSLCLTTCVGSASAIGNAMDAINLCEADLAIAGGSEALCRVVLSGFHALKVVAPEGCRPFDKNRPGMTVGEGAGILILESLEHARKRGAKILALLRGFGATCDAHHITAPDPEATQAARAIQQAIDRAAIAWSDVDYINAHGTGTRDNDSMEAVAIQKVFGAGEALARKAAEFAAKGGCMLISAPKMLPPVSSTKRATGHTFGAAGVIEAILCIQSIRENVLPPNSGSLEPDTALWQSADPVARIPLQREITHALSTNFAFGGNNTALLFSRANSHG